MIRQFTVADLPPELRREGAMRVRNSLRQLLTNPFLTADQIQYLKKKISDIDRWERGEIPNEPIPSDV